MKPPPDLAAKIIRWLPQLSSEGLLLVARAIVVELMVRKVAGEMSAIAD